MSAMHIAYCTNVRLPSERAHGHQVARVCDALVKLGHEVEIIAPRRCDNPVQEDFWTFHGVDWRVALTHTSSFDGIACRLTPGLLGLWMTTWSYLHYARHRILEGKFDLLYTRTPEILPMLLATKIPVVLELHKLPRYGGAPHRAMLWCVGRSLFVRRCRRCALTICLTTPMREELVRWGVPEGNVLVEPDAVDLQRFEDQREPLSEEAIPADAIKIGYAGQLISMGLSKGIPELCEALKLLRKSGRNVHGLFAAPPPRDDILLHQLAEVGTYFGFLPQQNIPSFLAACDVLVYPAPASDHPFFVRDTSPLKLFEYMAARKPIVTADLPPIRDILDETTAIFCRPGDPQDLARAIAEVIDHPAEAAARVERAFVRIQEHTWEKRMARIMTFVSAFPLH